MASFNGVKKKVMRINNLSRLRAIVAKIILSDKFLADAKAAEFREGENPDGSMIGSYRSLSYELFKEQINPIAGGAVDLMLTGAFIDSFFTKKAGASKFIFGATDKKKAHLVEKYGEQIMGLSQTTFDVLQKEVYSKQLLAEIRKQI